VREPRYDQSRAELKERAASIGIEFHVFILHAPLSSASGIRQEKPAALAETTYFAASDWCEPLSGPPAFAVREAAANSFTLALIGPKGPNLCCSAGNPSA
jgi:hypothetical protein